MPFINDIIIADETKDGVSHNEIVKEYVRIMGGTIMGLWLDAIEELSASSSASLYFLSIIIGTVL